MRKDGNYFVVLKIDGVFEYHHFNKLRDALKFASEHQNQFIDIEDKHGEIIFESMKTCVIGGYKYTEFRSLSFERIDAKC